VTNFPFGQGKFLENGANPAVSADRGSKFGFGELKDLKCFALFLSCSHRVMPNSSGRVCQHPRRTATQPGSFKILISATQSEASVWIRISSASFTSRPNIAKE
jgi:hypothetical protein